MSTKICRYYQLVSEGRISELEQKLSSLRKTADVASCERRYDSDEEDDEDLVSHLFYSEHKLKAESHHCILSEGRRCTKCRVCHVFSKSDPFLCKMRHFCLLKTTVDQFFSRLIHARLSSDSSSLILQLSSLVKHNSGSAD